MTLECKIPTIRIIGNFIAFNDNYAEKMIDLGIVKVFEILLNDKIRQVQRETCWAISNLTSGTKQQATDVIKNSNIIPLLVNIIKTELDYGLKKEAFYALTNACNNSSDFEINVDLVRYKVLEILLDNINLKSDVFFIDSSLCAIKSIFTSGDVINKVNKVNPFAKKFEDIGGLVKLELLQKHNNSLIYEKAQMILDMFYNKVIYNGTFDY